MTRSIRAAMAVMSLLAACGCHESEEGATHPHGDSHHHGATHKVVVTVPAFKDVRITQQYVALIRSQRHIKVCALEMGYIEQIPIREGQIVRRGDLLFGILPTLYQAKLETELAEVQIATLEYNNTNRLFAEKVVSQNEVALHQAKLAKAQAKAKMAQAEVNFTTIRAPFDGIVDRLHEQVGTLVKEGDVLTTLSDNSVMWVYFNVPEARYLEFMNDSAKSKDLENLELFLADGSRFRYPGRVGAIEAKFNNETGNIPFRADFPNPDRLLRHGQTGNIQISQSIKNALIVPQRASFETLDKRYLFVVGQDGVARQREIKIAHELEDVFVIKSGLKEGERFVVEGVQQVREGEKIEYQFNEPEKILANQKNHAE